MFDKPTKELSCSQDHTLTINMCYVMIINSYMGGIVMENNEVKSINERLRDISIEWLNSDNVKKWIKRKGRAEDLKKWLDRNLKTDQYFISEPFFFGVPEYEDKNKPLIMVVGQETDLYGNIENIIDKNGGVIEENIIKSQSWVTEVTRHLNNTNYPPKWKSYTTTNDEDEIYLKKHSFFLFLIALSKKYNVCWNNLDKIHYTAEIDVVDYNNGKLKKKEKAVTLYVKDEKILFGQQIDNGKTLLENEIDIIKPDMVLFVTGPNYKESMEYQLSNYKEIFGDNIPNINKEDNEIVDGNEIDGIKYYWTYHPVYLSRIKMTDKVIEALNNLLPDKSNI